MFHGGGGYDWDTVYNMPIWLRRFTFTQLNEHFENERKELEKQRRGSENLTNKTQIAKPPTVDPTYVTKAPKK